jgi:NADPH-dependent 2,4-dienoyl-CoA reductase/sulfur reductase-like enzyme/nitrite reductase/ring-hydroxylating ferredoxin subunit
MGGEQAKLSGPDLAVGIAEGEIRADAPLLGHSGGEPVLLVRRGDDVLAVAATCTHYGGPLAEGLITGDLVHCPWHHACFDLRTGAPVGGPGLSPIACFAVERAGGKIRVGARRDPPPVPATATAPAPRSIAIVGAGAAALSAAETLRREGYAGAIRMFGADEAPPVDRPNLSKDYLAGTAPEEWIPLRPPSFFEEQGIELALAAPVTGIDFAGRRLSLAGGRSESWNALLLATGAEPIRLSVPGADLPHVRTLRTLGDARAIIARAQAGGDGAGKRAVAVVVGASFIGMEAAASLRARGLEVHVVAPDAQPFARLLGPEVGAFLRGLHEERGVHFHLGQTVTAVDARAVTLSGGDTLEADLVVVGIGVRPASALAEAAGLAVDRGVLVDERLETSVRGVFAAGDIARFPYAPTGERVRIEHWVVATRMGRVAALNMLGRGQRFVQTPFFWSTQYDVTLSYVGHAESWDRIDIAGSLAARDCTIAYRHGDRTLAVATIGRDHTSLEAEVAIERGDEGTLRTFGRER